MGSKVRRISLRAFTIVLCAIFSVGADLASAKRAYEQKDYATAFKEFTPLAEKGNAGAQFILGKMYWDGQGVLKDPDQAMKWFKLSAAQGNADAQFYLGSFYLLPHRDIAEGVKWLRLAAKDNLEFYENALRAAEGQMTPDQIAKGKELAAAWKPRSASTSAIEQEK